MSTMSRGAEEDSICAVSVEAETQGPRCPPHRRGASDGRWRREHRNSRVDSFAGFYAPADVIYADVGRRR